MAAERQLKEAITLFFEQRDSVAIHTLASASHEILYQLGKAKGIRGVLKDPDRIKDKYWKEYIRDINQWKNFFKHAKTDPKAVINFPSVINIAIIYDCIYLYYKLTKGLFHEAKVWTLWLNIKFPDWIKEGQFKRLILGQFSSVDPDDFGSYLKLLRRTDGNSFYNKPPQGSEES